MVSLNSPAGLLQANGKYRAFCYITVPPLSHHNNPSVHMLHLQRVPVDRFDVFRFQDVLAMTYR